MVYFICPVCNRKLKSIVSKHVLNHNITIKEFKIKYPDIKLNTSVSVLNTRKQKIIEDNIRCKECDKLILSLDRKIRKFCNHKCSAIFNNRKRRKIKDENKCLSCKKLTYNKKFCSKKCSKKYFKNKKTLFFKKWKEGKITKVSYKYRKIIREYLLIKYNYSCGDCGWDKTNSKNNICLLHIHHKDGNNKNNNINNLEVLCPNCHSLTDNFGWNKINNAGWSSS